MGGNVFKNEIEVSRLDKETYHTESKKILENLELLFGDSYKFSIVRSYKQKPSFGDLDIIYTQRDTQNVNIIESLKIFINNPKLYFKNGDVFSFIYFINNEIPFQIDLIKVQPDEYDFASSYFSYNDLGNLLGRIFHKAGFKLGHNGLWYILRDSTYVIKEFRVSNNWNESLEFIEYFNYFNIDFNTLEDIFAYTINNPFFNKKIYLLENRNNASRIRDRKRKTYTEFLKWLETTNQKLNEFDWSNKEKVRKEFLEKAFIQFPIFKQQYNITVQEYNKQKEIKLKFNGTIVSELTNLQGKELGQLMKQIRNSFSNEKLLSYNTEKIKNIILNEYDKLINKN